MKKLTATLTPEIRIVDAKLGIVDYVASDESLDCYREVIKASGWKFDHFKKNAPFVDSHDYGCIDKLVGKVIDFRVEKKQLIERVQWAVDVADNKLAQLGWKMTEAGYLKAVSVGFFPVKYVSKWGANPGELATVVTEMGLSAEVAAQVCCIYLEQQQIELSACIIGANPNALAKAHKDGAVADEDLAAVGLNDDGMAALHRAASLYSAADPAQRFLLDVAVGAIARGYEDTGKKNFPKTPETREPADGRAAAELTQQRDREQFLREFTQLTQNH